MAGKVDPHSIMSPPEKRIYEFAPFRIDAGERVLLRDGQPVPVTPKAFEILLALVESSGHLVEKDELMKRVWPDTFVEEANLANNISLLRKLLGDVSDSTQFIQTVPDGAIASPRTSGSCAMRVPN